MNQVCLIGRIGQEVEVKELENNLKIAEFSLATDESYKDKSGTKKEVVEWHNIKCFGTRADFAEKYLTKGKPILVLGKIKTERWEKEGVKGSKTSIYVDNFEFLPTERNES